jgi:hypothetical protein
MKKPVESIATQMFDYFKKGKNEHKMTFNQFNDFSKKILLDDKGFKTDQKLKEGRP